LKERALSVGEEASHLQRRRCWALPPCPGQQKPTGGPIRAPVRRRVTVDCGVVDPVVDGAEALLAEFGKLLHAFGVANVADGVEEATIRMLFLRWIRYKINTPRRIVSSTKRGEFVQSGQFTNLKRSCSITDLGRNIAYHNTMAARQKFVCISKPNTSSSTRDDNTEAL
jgi:hypothetical protein